MNFIKKEKRQFGSTAVLLALGLILILTSIHLVFFAGGPTHFGDDISYALDANTFNSASFVETNCTAGQASCDILSVRLLQVIPIAVMYKLFGVGILSSSAWDGLAFLMAIILTFLIGRELYNDYVGILSAFLLAAFPMANILSVTMSDNVPMMFFVSLSAFLLIKAVKNKSRQWYFASGFTLMLAPLTTPEGFVLWVIVLLFALVEMLRGKIKYNKNMLYLLYGFAIAFALLAAFNYVNSGNPLVTFTANANYYGQTNRTDISTQPFWNALQFYPEVIFPYDPFYNPGNYMGGLNDVGIYFYVLIVSILYLAFVRDKRSYLPLFWLVVGFLYLEFGPAHVGVSPLSYALSHRLDRYLLLIAVPMSIIISAAVVSFVENSKKDWMHLRAGLAFALIALIVVTSVQIIFAYNAIIQTQRYPQLHIAQYLETLPNTTPIYLNSIYADMIVYMKFNNMARFAFEDGGIRNCSNIVAGSYVVLPQYPYVFSLNYTPEQVANCTWELVLTAPVDQNQSYPDYNISQGYETNLYYVPQNRS